MRARLSREEGITLTELLGVLVILGILITAMATVFVSASRSESDQSSRFQAQQQARLALNALRRDLRCAKQITGTPPTATITISLADYCPTYAGTPPADESVIWCTEPLATQRHRLWRYPGTAPVPAGCGPTYPGGTIRADYLTTGDVFTAYSAPSGQRGTLTVVLPVDVTPADARQKYTLEDKLVLRNSPRTP